MLSDAFIAALHTATSDASILDRHEYGGKWNPFKNNVTVPTDDGTSHLCTVDSDRMAVSLTTTINTAFGSAVMSPSTGILFNNEMDDFSLPDRPNTYGLQPSQVGGRLASVERVWRQVLG